MKQSNLEQNLIVHSGDKSSLIPDLSELYAADQLLTQTGDVVVGQAADRVGYRIMDNYNLSQDELKHNYAVYKVFAREDLK